MKGDIMKNISDTFLVSFDYAHGDIPVLIVGRKNKGVLDIINAFQGDEVKELYQTKRGEKNELSIQPIFGQTQRKCEERL